MTVAVAIAVVAIVVRTMEPSRMVHENAHTRMVREYMETCMSAEMAPVPDFLDWVDGFNSSTHACRPRKHRSLSAGSCRECRTCCNSNGPETDFPHSIFSLRLVPPPDCGTRHTFKAAARRSQDSNRLSLRQVPEISLLFPVKTFMKQRPRSTRARERELERRKKAKCVNEAGDVRGPRTPPGNYGNRSLCRRRHGVLLVWAPLASLSLAGQEHGRTHPISGPYRTRMRQRRRFGFPHA